MSGELKVPDMFDEPTAQKNHLLAALTLDTQSRLFPQLELTSLSLGTVLYEPGEIMHFAYFPTDSIVSLLYVMHNSESAEIAVVGNDGLVGASIFMGGESTSSRAIVQSAGSAYRLSKAALMNEFNRHGDFMLMSLNYTQALITQMVQTAACNRHHTTDQQLCRWLLMSLDRLSGNTMKMTEKLICNMLGIGPEGVVAAAATLRNSGVIQYEDGLITVLDRPQLEHLCCECYTVVKQETDRLLRYSTPRAQA